MSEGPAEPEMSASEATSSDIRRLYLLFLRREPESVAPEGPVVGLFARVGEFVRSQEFADSVLDSVINGRLPSLACVLPDRQALAWACRRLQLDRQTRRKLFRARSWVQAYDALLNDARLIEAAGLEQVVSGVVDTPLWALSCVIQGEVESFDGQVLRGWARRIDSETAPLQLQVWVNGALQAVTTTGAYRHDLMGRFGAEGAEGFEARLPPGLTGDVRWEVREATSNLLIGQCDAHVVGPVGVADLLGISAEVSALRRAVEALEARIPPLMAQSSFPLADYASYYDHWRRFAAASRGSDAGVVVMLDAIGCRPEFLEDAVLSVVAQSHAHNRLVVGIDQDQRGFLIDLIVRVGWISSIDISYVIAVADADWRVSVALCDADEVVQLMPGDGILHVAAVAEVAGWFDHNGADALYFDEDELGGLPGDEVDSRSHVSPSFKPSFDAELFLQTPYAGAFVAFRRDAWQAVSPVLSGTNHGADAGCRCLLEMMERPETIGHLGMLLASRQRPLLSPGEEIWAKAVVERLGEDAAITPHEDILGAMVPSALKIRRRIPVGTTAAVIIPTRDRYDLLRPCVDSLLAREGDNASRMRILLVDHQTSEPACVSYIEDLERSDRIGRIPYVGPFNWALMNNLAARESDADVLVFLNNDTVVVSPDWLDALVSEAMRPDVGVVGSRLIYADGALQHAGFVSRDARDNFLTHEGVGLSGSDAGHLGRHALVHETIAVTGACMAVRKDVFQKLGGFDAARFPVEGNDVDFCFKARGAGLKVLYSPYATLYHLESRTRTFNADDQLLSAEASRRLWDRWGSAVCPDPYFNRHFDRRARPFTRLVPPPPIG